MAPIVLNIFWHKAGWYEEFLTEQLKDISVNVGEWAPVPEKPSAQSRTVHSFHPAKISFPGLPSHAESWKVQTLEVTKDSTGAVTKVSVKETNSFRGIPYADYFNVNTEWTVVAVEDGGDNSNSSEQQPPAPQKKCKATIHLDFQFLKSTWLQGTIESNTKAELIEVYELWLQMAQETLRRSLDKRLHISTSAGNLSLPGSSGDLEQAMGAGEGQADDSSMGYEVGGSLMRSGESTPVAKSRSFSSGYPSDADEELQFFDCEDGGGRGTSFGNTSTGDLAAQAQLAADLQRYYPQSFGGGVRELQSGGALLGKDMRAPQGLPVHGVEGGPTSTRDIAVTIVEAVFVLAEFSYWQVHQLYAYELKEVFDIDPGKVVARVLNSFLPGWHSPLLLQPDLYGPVLAVAALPQSLLISMEISRHGCNPTSQLGNALVVSLFIWVGLSAIYRLLALLVAPGIELKHCLCVTGYGFFAWNVALLCIFPLENLYDMLRIPTMLPLVIFGLPSSLAQGAMFWEHTPASSMTLQPSQLPPAMQRFATTHNRCLQRILWLLPKVLAFLLVAGTHYQFLWYMARVFLPGRRQLCKLSALVQPSHYADILTQKELRNFAISLFGKN